MALQPYMAITSTEFYSLSRIPPRPAWMACHFSGHSSGLSNMPDTFPSNSIIMLDDSIPIQGHDPQRISNELAQLYSRIKPDGFLLDFQRTAYAEAAQLAKHLCLTLPFPVAVSHLYAADLDCPVFLPPPPLHMPLKEYLKAWAGRKIWMEIAPESQIMTVTAEGCQISPGMNADLIEPAFYHENLFCRYHTQVLKDSVIFPLQRGWQEWESLCKQAETFGISVCVGRNENSR